MNNGGCHHTIHAIDDAGNTTGTWVIRTSTKKGGPTRRKVVCRVCKKFYGYIDDGKRK